MKKALFLLLICILIASLAAMSFACKNKVSSDKEYHLYTYDAQKDSFVKMSASLRFGADLSTFEYTFGDGDLTIIGAVEHTKTPDSYVITCGDEVVSLVRDRYRKSMVEGGASEEELAVFDVIADSLDAKSQYFVYDGKLFTADAVELFRCGDEKSDAYEGIYRMDSADTLTRLRGGFAYTQDDNDEYTVKSARYSVSRGIMTIISLDENGKDRYQNGVLMRKRYLMAKITIPSEGELLETDFDEQLKTSAFVSKIKENASEYAGKTIAVLCEAFYTDKMK